MKNTNRSQRGVSGLVIVLATAFMIILPLGFMGYEYMRYTMVQQELRAVTDASALAGAVGIATNGGIATNSIWTQDASAMAAAYDTFCENSLSGTPLLAIGFSNANVNPSESSSTSQPAHFNNSAPWTNVNPNTAQVNFVLLDASGNQTNWNSGGGPIQNGLTPATSLRVDAYYGYTLPLLGGLNIGPFTMNASSAGGLPQLDVILCFDISGSMDDFTNITFINRYWVDTRTNPPGLDVNTDLAPLGLPTDGTFQGGCIEYDIPPSSGSYGAKPPFWSTPSDGSASGPLYYVTGCNTQPTSSNGTSLNVQPPMNLNQGPSGPVQFYFMAQQRNSGQGLPPGNFTAVGIPGLPVVTNTNAAPCYTDLVVNLNHDSHWITGAPPGFSNFQTIAWAVEASRGNLEGSGIVQSAINPMAATATADNKYGYIIKDAGGTKHYFPNGFQSATVGLPGSQLAYWNYVQSNTHPLSDAVQSANSFFQFLYGSADCHFGLICFSDGIGTSSTDTWADGSESPPGSANINGWTTASVNGATGSPPLSANVAGSYVGGPSMGAPTNTADPNGTDPAGGNGSFPLPLIQLNNGQAYTTSSSFDNFASGTPVGQYMVVQNGQPWGGLSQISVDTSRNSNPAGIVATGSTDITDALAEAIRELTPGNGLTRPHATRAIVLFTDGSPNIDASNMPPASNFSGCLSDCQAQGSNAHSVNPPITIFSIGLAMDSTGSTLAQQQSQLLSAIDLGANGGPSGPSSWVQVTSVSQIQTAFQSIAKNLVVITK